jgi:hypothetical protein
MYTFSLLFYPLYGEHLQCPADMSPYALPHVSHVYMAYWGTVFRFTAFLNFLLYRLSHATDVDGRMG